MNKIPVFRPSLGPEESDAVKQVLESGWWGLGPKVEEFEKKFARYIGAGYSVGLNSGTAALELALKLANVEGREVITTPMTFISTNHAILFNGGLPVFADVEPDTLNIDVREIERLITDKTRAILLVHYGGHPCDMDPIVALGKKYRLEIIEDCAHACGAVYKGKKVGSIGHFGCFSFQAVKNLACGEGGMITTDSEAHIKRLKSLRWLGIDQDTWNRSDQDKRYSWNYTVRELGFKAHLNDIPAAIGIAQLEKLDRLNRRRREINGIYSEALSELDWIETPVEKEYAESAFHNYVIKLPSRDRFIDYMASKGVSIGVHYFPNHLYKMYEPYYRKLPVVEEVWKKIATLPMFPDLTDSEVAFIIDKVKNFRP